MEVKLIELRDDGTFIPLLCVDMNPQGDAGGVSAHDYPQFEAQRYLLRRCGYPCDGRPNIAITHLGCDGGPMNNDPHSWGGRTRPVAHAYIIENWDKLKDGDVVDVEFILGEKPCAPGCAWNSVRLTLRRERPSGTRAW